MAKSSTAHKSEPTHHRATPESITPAPVYSPSKGSGEGGASGQPWYSQKVLGLPVWGILLLVAAVAAYLWYSNNSGTSVTAPSSGSGSGSGNPAGSGTGSSGGGGGGSPSGGTTDPYYPPASGNPIGGNVYSNPTPGGPTAPASQSIVGPGGTTNGTAIPNANLVTDQLKKGTSAQNVVINLAPQIRQLTNQGTVSQPVITANKVGNGNPYFAAGLRAAYGGFGTVAAERQAVATQTLIHGGPPVPQTLNPAPGPNPNNPTAITRGNIAVAGITHGAPRVTLSPSHPSYAQRATAARTTSRTVRVVPQATPNDKPNPNTGTAGHAGVRP